MTLIMCMKCRKATPTIDEHIVQTANRSRLVGKCGICGTNKSKFISSPKTPDSNQKGKGEAELKISKSAYEENAPEEIEGYKLDKELSNRKTRVYHNPETKKTIVGHRGTDPKNLTDLKNDALIAVGLLDKNTSKRVKLANEITDKASKKYNGELTHTGHSLGSSIASEVQKKGQKVESYNPGSSPLQELSNKILGKRDKQKEKDTIHHLTGIDPISVSKLLSSDSSKKVIHTPKKINVHSISNFGAGKKPRGRPPLSRPRKTI